MAFLCTRLAVLRNTASRVASHPSSVLFSSSRGRSESSAQALESPAYEDCPAILNPFSHPDYFGVRKLVKLKDLYDARVHLGHKEGTRNEFMKPFIFGSRLGVDIFDLNQTAEMLAASLNFTAHVAYQGGIIMFLSRNKQNLTMVESAAAEAGEYSHCRYWTGGVFTNASTQFGAVTRLPDLCIFINILNNVFDQHTGVRDCAKMLIPSVAIVDTNCDPRLITYPVPGNDDTPSAVKYYLQIFVEAIKLGKSKRKEDDEASGEASS